MPERFPPLVEIAETPYGPMLYPKADMYIGRSLKEYGEFSSGETKLFRQIVKPGMVVLDVGANIGAHTVPLAQMVGPRGLVLAFEPQRILHQMLCGNLALNSVPNVVAHAMALSDKPGTCRIPALDYGKAFNFGAVSIDMAAQGGPVPCEPVPVGTLDQFQLARLDFMKLDVEGFERSVLLGGAQTLSRHRPVLYVENDRQPKSAELIQCLFDMGYRLWWHLPPLFSPDNFRGNPENHFSGIASINMLAVPRHVACDLSTFREILSRDDWWQ